MKAKISRETEKSFLLEIEGPYPEVMDYMDDLHCIYSIDTVIKEHEEFDETANYINLKVRVFDL